MNDRALEIKYFAVYAILPTASFIPSLGNERALRYLTNASGITLFHPVFAMLIVLLPFSVCVAGIIYTCFFDLLEISNDEPDIERCCCCKIKFGDGEIWVVGIRIYAGILFSFWWLMSLFIPDFELHADLASLGFPFMRNGFLSLLML